MEPSPLVYDTAAAAAVWQRVGPALPAYDAAPCPAGACCPLPRRETDSEAMLEAVRLYRQKKISLSRALDMSGIGKTTFYKKLKEFSA